MAVIELTIEQPVNNEAFSGTPVVDFQGSSELPDELNGIPIYYRWYSSLYQAEEGVEEQYSMNIIATNAADSVYSHQLSLGTHVITFAASDVAGESLAEFETIQHAGVTGGSNEGDDQCLLHVFSANLIEPPAAASLPHNAIRLEAEAPSQWGIGVDIDPGPPSIFEVNEDYHAINRLQYRWLFEPVGAPASRPIEEFIPTAEDLDFLPPDPDAVPIELPARVEYTASLPATAIGQYRITLFVEDNLAELAVSHSRQITVTMT